MHRHSHHEHGPHRGACDSRPGFGPQFEGAFDRGHRHFGGQRPEHHHPDPRFGDFHQGRGWGSIKGAERMFREQFEGDNDAMFDGEERGPRHRGHGFGPGFGPGFGGPRGRGPGGPGRPLEQGDLRWLALDLIAAQPRHGYEVIKAIEDAMGGHYAPSPGAVYPMLTLLDETGLIASESQGSKKRYSLTDEGRAEIDANKPAIEAAKARLNDALNRFGGIPTPDLHRAMHNLRYALQVRLSKGELTPEALSQIIAAFDRAATEIAQS